MMKTKSFYESYGVFLKRPNNTIQGYTEESFSMAWNNSRVRVWNKADAIAHVKHLRKRMAEIRSNLIKNQWKEGKRKPFISKTFTMKGKHHSEDTKKKISEKQTGQKNSQYGTIWITNGKNNKKIHKKEEIPVGWYKGRCSNSV